MSKSLKDNRSNQNKMFIIHWWLKTLLKLGKV